MLVAGVDDAGRGPVIGPLIIAGIALQDEKIPSLSDLGVKDSKTLTPHRREILNKKIRELAVQVEVQDLSSSQVDETVLFGWRLHRLNWLEAVTMAEVIRKLHPEVVYVDAADINETRFGQQIKETLPFDVNVISEHHADVNYAVVSAASIVAKVYRDEAIALLREKYGDFGSGYPSDPKTKRFLRNCAKEEVFPNCVRKSWKTVKKLMSTRVIL